MKCIISEKETRTSYGTLIIHKEVLEFARWYRSKLNVQQIQKMKIVSSKNAAALVTLRACLNTFIEMKNKGYSWNNIQITLADELMLKGLLDEQEHTERTVF